MKRIVLAAIVLLSVACAGRAADEAPQGKPVPYQVAPLSQFNASVKDWGDKSMPHYSIMYNGEEWKSSFVPGAPTRGGKPAQPPASLFEKAFLVGISRVSGNQPDGEPVLSVKSLLYDNGELLLTYGFFPPVRTSGPVGPHTILVAIPMDYQQYSLRIFEEEETPATRAAAKELEEAKAAGRYKPPALKN